LARAFWGAADVERLRTTSEIGLTTGGDDVGRLAPDGVDRRSRTCCVRRTPYDHPGCDIARDRSLRRIHAEEVQLIAEGYLVAAHLIVHGLGPEPVQQIQIERFENGRIVSTGARPERLMTGVEP
jgi:hypothetical protein